MLTNKRGLSAVVATLLIVLLALVAIGIVWAVIRGTIQTGAGQAELTSKCLQASVRATAASCGTDGTCNATLERDDAGDDIGGAKVVFTNGTDSYIYNVTGNIEPLVTERISEEATGLLSVTQLEVVVFFVDEAGNENLCSTTNTFTL